MKKSYVYKITCKITGEFYFGSSFNAKRNSYWGGGKRIRERVAQYGKENFVKEILEEFDDRVEAHRVENEYIEQFRNDDKCLNQQLDRKFNTYGEESCAKRSAAERGEKHHNFGKHRTEEAKEKISASLKGLMSGEKAPWYGKHLSEEHRSKISVALRGKTLSEGHKANISTALRGKPQQHKKHWRKNPVTGKREWYD